MDCFSACTMIKNLLIIAATIGIALVLLQSGFRYAYSEGRDWIYYSAFAGHYRIQYHWPFAANYW